MRNSWEDWFQSDERLLWEGAPMRGFRHLARNLLFTAFGMPFFLAGVVCLVTGFGMIFAVSLGSLLTGIFLVFFSIPFIGVGGAMIFGSWYSDWYAYKYVRYALSNKRGYIATRWWSRKMEVLDIRPDQPIDVVDNRDVMFHSTTGFDSDGDRTTDRKGFENIADAKIVYGLIRALQAGEPVEPVQ